jgi:hypothetical protein
MSSKFFGNTSVKQVDTKKGGKSSFKTKNSSKTTAVRKTGRGK